MPPDQDVAEDREHDRAHHLRLDDSERVRAGGVRSRAVERDRGRVGEDLLNGTVDRLGRRIQRESGLRTADHEQGDAEDADRQQHAVASHGEARQGAGAGQARPARDRAHDA
ncbi:MAG: hypothetical protein CSA84_03645 [Actinomycetales bacterium]|nr:MAG: hypothetical protein CSA84_03645 [Actinomycetales bacterium]